MAIGRDGASEQLECWTAARLVELVPGSSLRQWRAWIPNLVSQGVLVKRGRRWLARRSRIEAALLAGAQ
jgi:hypothetical protein